MKENSPQSSSLVFASWKMPKIFSFSSNSASQWIESDSFRRELLLNQWDMFSPRKAEANERYLLQKLCLTRKKVQKNNEHVSAAFFSEARETEILATRASSAAT